MSMNPVSRLTFSQRITQTILPDYEGELHYRAQILIVVGLLSSISGVIFFLAQVSLGFYYRTPPDYFLSISSGTMMVMGLGILWFLRRKKFNIASWIILIGVWILTSSHMIVDAHPPTDLPAAFGYLLAIVLTVILLERRHIWIPTSVITLTYIGIYLLWDFGLLREITEIYSPGDVFFLIITWIISTAFIAVVLSTAL